MKRQEKPWITENILKKSQYKDFLYGKFMKTKCTEVEREYQVARQDIKKETRKSQFLYMRNKFLSTGKNIKKFWENINAFFGRKKTSKYPNTMTYETKNISGNFNIAQAFNNHYSEVAPNLIKKLPKNSDSNVSKSTPENNSSFLFQKTTRYEILTLLNKLDNKKSKDLYDFPIDIIKATADLIAEPLSHIINHSIKGGVFPETLKHAKVLPLFKKGPRDDIKNYRPISVLPLFDKVFEQVMHKRLSKFLDKNEYLDKNQHGFQKGEKLKNTSSCRYLGVIVDEKLNWKEHTKLVSTKIKQGVGMLHKVGRYISKRNLMSLYYALIQSHLTYCITSWGSPETPGLNQINKIMA
uniref:Reverse transcriptase domain-containing protein n=1 Tax=Clytia hemisphaerica TaxID=252671 RepID=A0A7M5UYY5_9CNID